jgi:Flp pilus assembly protein TadD
MNHLHHTGTGRLRKSPPLRGLLIAIGSLLVTTRGQEVVPPQAAASRSSDTVQARRIEEGDRYLREAEERFQSGRVAEAIAILGKKLAIEREELGTGHENVVSTLKTRAWWLEGQGDRLAARKDLEEVLAIREHEPDRKEWRITDAHRALQDLDRRTAMPPEDLRLVIKAVSLSQAIGELRRRGLYETARSQALEVVSIRRQILGTAHPDYASSLNDLACLYQALGDYARAEPLLREARHIRKQALGAAHPRYATSLNNLAMLYQTMGDYVRAESLCLEARDIYKQALGAGHPDYAGSLNNLASLYEAMGDYARAEPLYREARDIYRQALGAGHPRYAVSLGNLAGLYRNLGDYVRAEPLLREARDITKQALGTAHPDYAIRQYNLAMLYQAMGDYARAEPLYREARDITEHALGAGHPLYAMSLGNLGSMYEAMGDYAGAKPLLREARDIMKRALGTRHPEYAASLNNLAMLYHIMGDYARAESLYREARDMYKQALGSAHRHYATSLINLADLYIDMGDYARAEPLLREARQDIRQALGADHPDYLQCLINLAYLYEATGDPARARPLCAEVLAKRERLGSQTSQVLGERQRCRLLESLRCGLDAFISVSPTDAGNAADLYRHVLAWKAAIGTGQAGGRQARDHPELKPLLDELDGVRARHTQLAYLTPGPGQRDTWRRQLDELNTRIEELESDLAARSAPIGDPKQPEQLGPDELAAALPSGTVVVDFLDYNHFSPHEDGKQGLKRERRLLVQWQASQPTTVRAFCAAQKSQG